MKCKFCGEEVKPKHSHSNLVHWKTVEWVCSNCGRIKTHVVIDGVVERCWVKE